ncbi:ArsR/SmtB family transcription factor [Candidatus Manganitrophus noduliformans]|uniref:Winged helix-turn-helix transcriptional regulator n=1 Tax=Candidatus Manganitrophus noduliformans TaxID=2606439 RepID=A0A7X6IA98_9BACT|nr:metalloregulator ArsR/SmtB family transcription factor [Candidatus Manganitrophus noduliformans]NKE70149.1 winged helix-turn-helix transcriptional regulator [Candidatus Manganitrophus noduliformans]
MTRQRNHDLEDQVYRLHADICQTLANSKRLKIINILREKEVSAAEILSILQVPKANLSQHMTVLRQKGIVVARREGNTVCYRLARPKILKAFDLMREVLFEVLEEQQRLLKEYGKKKK